MNWRILVWPLPPGLAVILTLNVEPQTDSSHCDDLLSVYYPPLSHPTLMNIVDLGSFF